MKTDILPIIQTKKLNKVFAVGKKLLHALRDIDLTIHRGETLGIVGESGCGKSTLGKILLRLEEPTSGSISFQGLNINSLCSKEMRLLRRKAQIIFQDPYASLNPRMTVEEIVGEGLDIHRLANGSARRNAISAVLTQVGLDESFLQRYPHEFSGGQRQRLGIARALIVEPLFIVCDEPLSALDVCTQRQVMELLLRLKKERQLTYLFISHDLRAVSEIADHVAVMYLGKIVEHASAERLFNFPQHPYTQALLSAIPIPDPKKEKSRLRIILNGDPPTPLNPPSGCPFHPRCPYAMPVCQSQIPLRHAIAPGHFAACHKLIKQRLIHGRMFTL